LNTYIEHFYQSSDRLSLYYREYGAEHGASTDSGRPPVLCVPGLTRNSRDFEALATELGRSYRVISPDLRGRGRSAYDPNWANYVPPKYVQDMIELLDELGLERCAVVGTSLGGLIGMGLGALHRERVAGLVINDIGPELDVRGVQRIQSYAGKLPAVRSWEEAGAQARHVHAHALPGLDDADWMEFARRTYRHENGAFRPDVDPNISRAFSGATTTPDLWPLFAQLATLPMLAIRGQLSDLLSEQTLLQMVAMKPDLRVLRVPDRGHAPTLDEPECRSAIAQFLTQIP
jgi:pimeloyl-ACP methyl ester carboxylesterase